jgi:hypothetical protein
MALRMARCRAVVRRAVALPSGSVSAVQLGVSDCGHDELVVGQHTVVDGVGVGVGVQAGAEDLARWRGRALGDRGAGGGFSQARGSPAVGGDGAVEAALGGDPGIEVQYCPVLAPAARGGVGFVHGQQAEDGRGENRRVLGFGDLGQGVEGEQDRRPLVAAQPVGQVLPRVAGVDSRVGEQEVGGGPQRGDGDHRVAAAVGADGRRPTVQSARGWAPPPPGGPPPVRRRAVRGGSCPCRRRARCARGCRGRRRWRTMPASVCSWAAPSTRRAVCSVMVGWW